MAQDGAQCYGLHFKHDPCMTPMAERANFTVKFVEALEPADGRRREVFDKVVKSLYIRVTAKGRKTFGIRKHFRGEALRTTIGTFPDIKPELARKIATHQLGLLAQGIDPREEQKRQLLLDMTLGELLEDYLAAKPNLKPNAVKDYRDKLNENCADWLERKAAAITESQVKHWHKRVASPSRADGTARVLRALFNYAISEHQFESNPVHVLTRLKLWHKPKRRMIYLDPISHEEGQPSDLSRWWQYVSELDGDRATSSGKMIGVYLRFLLLTGLRSQSEAARLRWKDVDLRRKTMEIAENKSNRSVTLPLSDEAIGLLHEVPLKRGPYIFINAHGTPLLKTQHWIKKIAEDTGLHISPHDLRRSFISYAAYTGIREDVARRLSNHAINLRDAHTGYVIHNAEAMRAATNKVSDYIKCVAQAGNR